MKNMNITLICFSLLIVAIGLMGCLQEQRINTINPDNISTGTKWPITGNASSSGISNITNESDLGNKTLDEYLNESLDELDSEDIEDLLDNESLTTNI